MRILYVITKANWGGAQKYVFDLATAAHDAGHEVCVAYGEPGVLVDKLTTSGVATECVPGLARDIGFFREFQAFGGLRRFFAEYRPEVVHINSSKAGALGSLAARFARVPHIIFTAHGWAFNETRPWWQRGILYLASVSIVWLSHETICVSEAIRRALRYAPFTRAKLTVIHNGIECAPLLSREAARARLAPRTIGRYWIGMVSELHPTKRIEDAIMAMPAIVAKYPETILVVLGGGQSRALLEDLIRDNDLGDHVFLAGFVEDAPALLQAFDLFVHSSQSEALAYVLLEAGCASLPVVATNVGGIPEIITNNEHGLLVPPRKPASLARAVVSLMQDAPRAHELGARLHARVAMHFSKEQMVRDTLAEYSLPS